MNKAHASRNYRSSASRIYRSSIEKLEDRIALAADRFENNDSLSTAYNLGSLAGGTKTYTSLTMDDVADFYKFALTKPGTASTKIYANFVHSEGDLDLRIYSENGNLLRSSLGTTSQETVLLNGLASGNYVIKVSGKAQSQSPNYKLTLTTTGAVPTPIGPTIPDPPVVPPVTPPPAIDLVGAALNAEDFSNFNSVINVSARIKNTGTQNAGAYNVQYYLSRDNLVSIDDVLLIDTTNLSASVVRGTEAGEESELITSTLILPKNLPIGWTGEFFYIVMKTDSASQIIESNENNNFGQAGQSLDWEPVSIFAPDPSIPPPIISQFTIRLNLSGMDAIQQQVFQDAARRWSQIIIGDLPNQTYNGVTVDDLLIDASLLAIDGVGGVLGNAGPDAFRIGSNLPYHGSMRFDTADVAAMQDSGTFLSVILHEMGHVLGIGTIWDDKGLLSGAGTSNPRFTGTTATFEYNTLFGQTDSGVPVENGGGGGTRDSHWRESILTNELMTGYTGPGSHMPISRITVGSLKDLGYLVNMDAAEGYEPVPAAIRANAVAGSSSSALLSELLPANKTGCGCAICSGSLSAKSSVAQKSVQSPGSLKSDTQISLVATQSLRTSHLNATSQVFAAESISQPTVTASSLGSSNRKSSLNLFDSLFASEF